MDWPKITKDTTVEEVFEIHREIWNDILIRFERTGELRKPNTPYQSNCAFCEYQFATSRTCSTCPGDWGLRKDSVPHNCMSSGMYRQFMIHHCCCEIIWLYRQSFREKIIANIKAIRDIPRKKN